MNMNTRNNDQTETAAEVTELKMTTQEAQKVALHEYRLEQIEKNNAKRFDQILTEIQETNRLLHESQKDIIEHTLRIEELETKQQNLDSYIKGIVIIVLAEIVVETLKFIHP